MDHTTTGTRVRTAKDWRTARYGTVLGVAERGPWVEVLLDGEEKPRHFQDSELLSADAPYPRHWHRCEWCGLLESCNQCCGSGQPYDPYGPEDFDANGVLPGGHCDSLCYSHQRPRDAQYNVTADGGKVEFPNF